MPASTLGNWQREFSRWAPYEKRVVVYHGSQQERRTSGPTATCETRTSSSRPTRGGSARPARRTAPILEPRALGPRRFGRRSQFEEPGTLPRSRHLRRLGARSRTVLSGTPIMNRPLDLLSLLLFLMPDLFRDCRVTDRLEEVIAAMDSVGGVKKLRELLAPFCLAAGEAGRAAVAAAEDAAHQIGRARFKAAQAYLSVVGKTKEYGSDQHLFTALRKAANHPLLLKLDKYSDEQRRCVAFGVVYAGFFGAQADLQRVKTNLNRDDFSIHCICAGVDAGVKGPVLEA